MIELHYTTNEREAAVALGISRLSLSTSRKKGLVPAYCYTKFGYKLLRYCLPLLKDWQTDPTNTTAHARINESIQSSRIINSLTRAAS